MSSDVIIGLDGKPRCGWAGAGDTALGRYHDEVWGPAPTTRLRCSRRSPWAYSRSG